MNERVTINSHPITLHVPADFSFEAVAYAAVWLGVGPDETSWYHPRGSV